MQTLFLKIWVYFFSTIHLNLTKKLKFLNYRIRIAYFQFNNVYMIAQGDKIMTCKQKNAKST